jgi:hypothetical protein
VSSFDSLVGAKLVDDFVLEICMYALERGSYDILDATGIIRLSPYLNAATKSLANNDVSLRVKFDSSGVFTWDLTHLGGQTPVQWVNGLQRKVDEVRKVPLRVAIRLMWC